MMIKLTNILSELQVANPNITLKKVQDYYWDNIRHNTIEFSDNSPGWKEYMQICEPYLIKYNIYRFIGHNNFKLLSKPDLIKIYNQMRVLVRKHVGKEILNELQIKKPPITPKHGLVYDIMDYTDGVRDDYELFEPINIKQNLYWSKGWRFHDDKENNKQFFKDTYFGNEREYDKELTLRLNKDAN